MSSYYGLRAGAFSAAARTADVPHVWQGSRKRNTFGVARRIFCKERSTSYRLNMFTGAIGLLATSATASFAQEPVVSAPVSDVHYAVRADSASVATRHLGVTMTFNVASTAPVSLALPAWSPGHYTLLWFARRVSRFAASQANTQLAWHKLDYQTWEITPRSAGQVTVSFDYLADAVDRAVAWTSPGFAFFNGTNVFMYPTGRGFDWPATVSIVTDPSWRVTTGMMPRGAARTYTASNYHDLVDMPFWVGHFDLDSTRVVDRWIRLAMYPAGSMTAARRDRIFGWLQHFVPVEAAVFRDVPFRNYTVFLLSDTVVNGGGLEHQSSQMDELTTSLLDDPRMSSLFSHEFFHAWNVKRLRPAEMVPYRYANTDPTKWLWVSEGVTDYYAQVVLVRSRVTDSTGFLSAMAGDAAAIDAAPPTALSDASLSVWVDPTDRSGGLYYPKGAIAGFLLDIMVRDASNNAHSLDDVMRTLYQTTYKQGHGFTANDWWSTVSRESGGKSFDEFARRYVDGRDPMPFDSVLPLAGLRIVRDSSWEPNLGFAAVTDTSGARVVRFMPGANAAAAGIRIGDVVTTIAGIPIRNQAAFDSLRARYAKTRAPASEILPLTVMRGSESIPVNLPVRIVSRRRVIIVPVANATAKAVRIRNGIMHGLQE